MHACMEGVVEIACTIPFFSLFATAVSVRVTLLISLATHNSCKIYTCVSRVPEKNLKDVFSHLHRDAFTAFLFILARVIISSSKPQGSPFIFASHYGQQTRCFSLFLLFPFGRKDIPEAPTKKKKEKVEQNARAETDTAIFLVEETFAQVFGKRHQRFQENAKFYITLRVLKKSCGICLPPGKATCM